MTEQTPQPDDQISVMACNKCGPTVIEPGQPVDRCPKCGDAVAGPPIDVNVDEAAVMSMLVPAPVAATIAARSIKQLLEDGHREHAWDLLCRSWNAVFHLVLEEIALKQQRGPVPAAVMVLREYFNHRGDWREACECPGLEEMVRQGTRKIAPEHLQTMLDRSVAQTVAHAKTGFFAK